MNTKSTTVLTDTISAQPRLMTEAYLQARFKKVARQLGYKAKTAAEHKRWAKTLRAKLQSITGFDTMIKAPAKPVTTETVQCDGYTRHRMEIQTEPGIIMPFYVLVPEGKGPFPAVICPHGHASGGKYSPAGLRDMPAIAQQIKEYNYDYGVQFARAGAISFCPDARGFGERQERVTNLQSKGNILASSCQMINQMAYPLGQTVTGMWAWDLIALARYIQTRKDVIKDQIGCAGLSGGGLQTLWAAALDDENIIKCAVVSGYFYGYREALLIGHQNCSCNYVPGVYEACDMGDIAALIAPRPLLIETGDKDPLNGESGLKNVIDQLKITRKAYKTLGAEDKVVHDIFPAGHKWHGEIAVPWMMQSLENLSNSAE